MEQLLLFPETREEKLEREVAKLRVQHEKVRKSQYAKIGELKKLVLDLHYELETLKVAMCRSSEVSSEEDLLNYQKSPRRTLFAISQSERSSVPSTEN